MLRALTAAVFAALALAACGSNSSSGSPAATRAVQRALVATRSRAYHETFTENISLNASGLPSALAARLNSVSGTIDGTADVTNYKNFHIVVSLHGIRIYVRAVNGQLAISQDGVNYQPAPASTAQRFSQLVNLVPGIVGNVRNAQSLGSSQLSGQTVDGYSATISGNAVAPVFSTLGVNFGSPGPIQFTVYVSRSSGLPVRVNEVESASFDLSKLKRPGLTGTFSLKVSGTRNLTYP